MKRTSLSSVVMAASLVVSTLAVPALAGHGGGSGGRSISGSGFVGKSMGGNFTARSTNSFQSSSNFSQKLGSNLNRVSNGQPFVQKLQQNNQSSNIVKQLHTGNSNSSRVLSKPVLKNLVKTNPVNNSHAISSQLNKPSQNFKNCQNNWWCSNNSKFCGTSKFCGGCWPNYGCGYNSCFPWFGCCSYPSLWCGYGYGYGCNYGYGSYCGTNYGPQPILTTPILYTSSVGTATVSPTTIVKIETVQPSQTVQTAALTETQSAETLQEMQLGGSYALSGSAFGSKAGQLFIEIGEVGLGVKVDRWDDDKVSFTLPMIGLAKPADAKLHLVGSDGNELKSTAVRLTMPTQMTAQK